MSEVSLVHIPVPSKKTRTGEVVFYKATLFWIAVMTTVIALLLIKEFGWIG